jgi:hypothetical protein
MLVYYLLVGKAIKAKLSLIKLMFILLEESIKLMEIQFQLHKFHPIRVLETIKHSYSKKLILFKIKTLISKILGNITKEAMFTLI